MTNEEARLRYQNTKVAEEYDAKRFTSWHGRIAHHIEELALKRMVSRYFAKTGRVLDLPCGTGRLLPILIEKGMTVVGGDISEQMISVAKKRFQGQKNITFQKVDGERLPFENNAFDYCTCYRLMAHMAPETKKKILGEILRVTKNIAIVNFHFSSNAPLALWNRLFRKHSYPRYPVTISDVQSLAQSLGAKVLEVRKLSWYERCSGLVAIQKGL